MECPPIYLDKGGTSFPKNGIRKLVSEWASLLLQLEQVGRTKEFEAIAKCGLGIRRFRGVQKGWPNSPCGRWCCPLCDRRRGAKDLKRWIPVIVRAMGERGGCGGVTLTVPHGGQPSEELARLKGSLKKIQKLSAWRTGQKAWVNRIGLLVAIEVACGEGGRLHPHLHLAAFGPKRGEVRDFLRWVLASWLSLNPDADPQAQHATEVHAPGADWQGWVSYVLKGTQGLAEWPREALCAVLDMFPPRSRPRMSWGRCARNARGRLARQG